jgi:glycosyltransferase involved in cell wall biosynthesis
MQYAEAWAAKWHQVTCLTSRHGGLSGRETVNGVDVIRVLTFGKTNRATGTLLSMLCYVGFGIMYVLGHVRALRRYDVINTHFAIPTGPLGLLAAKVLSKPNVLTIIGGDIYDPTKRLSPHKSAFLRKVNRIVINSAERVIAISSDTRSRALEYYDVNREIHVVNYGFKRPSVEQSHDVNIKADADPYCLVAVGRLVARKGYEYLIRAMSPLPKGIVLLIIGDGPLEKPLRALAEELGVGQRIRFMGYQPRESIHIYLLQADCFVLSSLHEGLGIVVQEAMYAGLPIVATDNGGQVDLLKAETNAILVAPKDTESLANAIMRVYEDNGLAERMRQNNKRDIARYYIEESCELYIRHFASAISSRQLG